MEKIRVSTTVNAGMDKVWECWTKPEHITQWARASDDWHAPRAENDVRTGGRFKTVMAAKDGSSSFDFEGVYTEVREKERIAYTMSDGRNVTVEFKDLGGSVAVVETFDPENENAPEVQKEGWQAILDNFKKYAEGTA